MRRLFLVILVFGATCLSGCGRRAGADPFATGARGGAGGEAGEGAGGRGEPDALGEECTDDAQCDDGFDCTKDRCVLSVGRCRHTAEDPVCDDGVYCNGVEKCTLTLGCQPGAVVSCSDDKVCTIDTCVEKTQTCEHERRDADGDGDPPLACQGNDCDDFDPLVSGDARERCGNGRDDDCDGEVDEDDCVRPLYDRCSDALDITDAGTYAVSTVGASKDYAITCEQSQAGRAFREVVLAVSVPGDAPQDLDIVALARKSAPAPFVASLTETTFADPSTSHSVVLPKDTTAGDILLVLFASQASPLEPAGAWHTVFSAKAASKVLATAFVASASRLGGATTLDITTKEEVAAAAQVFRITGASSSLDVIASEGASGTDANPDPAKVDIPWHNAGDSLVLAFGATAGGPALVAPPSGYSQGHVTETAKSSVLSAVRAVSFPVVDPGPFELDGKIAWAAGTIVVRPSSRQTFDMVLAASNACGDVASETACERSIVTPDRHIISRLLVRAAEPGVHAIYLATDREAEVEVDVRFRDPEPIPENETCGTFTTLLPNEPVRAILTSLASDLGTQCTSQTGDLVYGFDLDEPQDVRLQAVSLDGYGEPTVSLRDATCVEASAELTCRSASPLSLFARALPAGSYRVALSGSGPTEAELTLALAAPTEAPASEGCADPPALEAGVAESVSLEGATDAVKIGCLVGAADASYRLELAERSDVMLVASGSAGDTGSVLVASAPCRTSADAYSCGSSSQWPVRTVAHGVGPGSVRAVVETAQSKPASVTAFTRPATASVFVQGADECSDAYAIPPEGGRFEGNTDNQYAQYDVSCDYAGAVPGGAPEQLLELELKERRRVVVDASGSNYQAIVAIRRADACPGEEVADTCALTYTADDADEPTFSFIDAELDAGRYFIQIDGYDGDKGRWVLEVFTAEVSGDQRP